MNAIRPDLVRPFFDVLTGAWEIDRVILPHGGQLRGVARFASVATGETLYREHGILTTDVGSFEATRSYRYRFSAGSIIVYFDEQPMRLFHQIVPDHIDERVFIGRGEHLCGSDLYRTTYEFSMSGPVSITHVVVGPRKDYVIRTSYTRP